MSRAGRSCGPRIGRASTSSKGLFGTAEIPSVSRSEPVVEAEMFQVIDPAGHFEDKLDPHLPKDDLVRIYRTMSLVRTLDTRMLSLQRQGRIGFYVPSTGQEAAQVGAADWLRPEACVLPAYREPGAALWRGGSPLH